MTNKVKCAFYGSLRKPMYNYSRFIQTFGYSSIQYNKTIVIGGFDMYDLGMYPGIKHSEESHTLVVDLFQIDNAVYESIYDMEQGANFYEDDILIDHISYKIFPYLGKVEEDKLVTSGDWLSYYNNLNKIKSKVNDNTY